MIRRYAFTLLGLFFLVPAMLIGQNSQNDFNLFFFKFKQAVMQKDTATLTTLMMPTFNFIRAQNVSPSDVFKGLDADEGLPGTNLQQAVQGQPSSYQAHNSNAPARVLRCTPNRDRLHLSRDLPAGRSPPLAMAEHDYAYAIVDADDRLIRRIL